MQSFQLHCKSFQFLGERFPETLKKFLRVFRKLLKIGFYLLVSLVRCSKMLGQFIQIVTELLEIFVCHDFVWPRRRFFTCPNGFSRTTTLRGGSIGNQKSARQRFRSKRKPFCNRRSNLTRALETRRI